MRTRTAIVLFLAAVLCTTVWMGRSTRAMEMPCPMVWDDQFGDPGANGEVYVLYTADETSPFGPALYAGGKFTAIDNVSARCVARWDSVWTPLGSGVDSFRSNAEIIVGAFAEFTDDDGPGLYVGGEFTHIGGVSAKNIAKWDGTDWSPLLSGIDGCITALASFDDGSGEALYAGGLFNTAGDTAALNVARWNGDRWSPLGAGLAAGDVEDLFAFNDGTGEVLYAGGSFRASGGEFRLRIAKWNPGTGMWDPVGTGFPPGSVRSLVPYGDSTDDTLYAAGTFVYSLASPKCIAKWNGAEWDTSDIGFNNWAADLCVYDDVTGANDPALFAVGRFTTAGGVPARGIACRRSDHGWRPVGEGIAFRYYRSVWTMSPFYFRGEEWLYVGGAFDSANGEKANNITRLKGACYVATAIQHFSCRSVEAGAKLTWELDSNDQVEGFRVLRRESDAVFKIPLNSGGLLSSNSREYIDNDISAGKTYHYQLVVVSSDGKQLHSHEISFTSGSHDFALYQNEPNPFHPQTAIRFDLPKAAYVELSIFNVRGKLIDTLLKAKAPAGLNEITWKGRDSRGRSVPSGVYVYHLATPGFTQSRKMILLQ